MTKYFFVPGFLVALFTVGCGDLEPHSGSSPRLDAQADVAAIGPGLDGGAHADGGLPGDAAGPTNHSATTMKLQQGILEAFEQSVPVFKATASADPDVYRQILFSLPMEQQAALAPALANPLMKVSAFYAGSPWAFTAHVLNLPSSGDPVADAKAKAVNDVICTTAEETACANGAPSVESAFEWIRMVVAGSAGRARLLSIGQSRQGRPLQAIEIGEMGAKKPTLWFNSVMHGNEPMGLEVIKDLTAYLLSQNAEAKTWLSQFNFVIIPLINPDGYAFSHEKISWRKNARALPDGRIAGLDLNRAFPTKDPYRSPDTDPFAKEWMPFDGAEEPEVKALTAYAERVKPLGALDFHSNAHFVASPNVANAEAKLRFQSIMSSLQEVIRDEKGMANTYRVGSANEIFQVPDASPQAITSTSIQWMWENFQTIGLAIELLDENSTEAWPSEETRETAVAGVRPAWKRFINLMSQTN